MQPSSGIKTWQWVVTAIVVIVLIVIGIMVFGNKGAQAPSNTPVGTTSNGTSPSSVNNIVMADQYPGNVVYLSSVQLANPGWVVIQKDNNGTPGAIIGTAYATAGINPVRVTLTQPMVDGGTYYATLYSASSATAFNPNVDKPLTDSNGSAITHVFHSSATASANLKG